MSDVEVAGTFFLDTNIFVYSFDASAPEKRSVARELIALALTTHRGIISTQVVQEFLNVALRKFETPLGLRDARSYLDTVLLPLCHHVPSIPFYHQALLVREETGFAFYDALILTAAIAGDAFMLFTEDLQHGRRVRGVEIVNPFL